MPVNIAGPRSLFSGMTRALKSFLTLGIIAFVLFVLFSASCTRISSGFVGVRTTFGKIHEQPLEPGLHFITPFCDNVVEIETRLISYEVTATAASKDLQTVKTIIAVQHSINGAMAPSSYQAIGDISKFDIAVVNPAVMESLKAVTAKYTAEELITKREAVKQQVSDAIQAFIDHTLKEKSIPGALHIANVAIKNFDFSAEFNGSIEAKVKAQQEALRALTEKTKRITEVEASARERELAADAEAYQLEKVSTQKAAAIERESKALSQNPLLIQMRAIEKWKGDVPHYMGGGQPVPFIDVEKMRPAGK